MYILCELIKSRGLMLEARGIKAADNTLMTCYELKLSILSKSRKSFF